MTPLDDVQNYKRFGGCRGDEEQQEGGFCDQRGDRRRWHGVFAWYKAGGGVRAGRAGQALVSVLRGQRRGVKGDGEGGGI